MKKKVSLKDIAERVGVSTATVSYVLSKGKDSGVSEEVSKRVKQAAKELNYQPNQIAKSLKMGKTFTIGLVVADISNPFFAHIARIVEDEAAAKNYTVIFGSSDEKPKKMWRLLQYLRNSGKFSYYGQAHQAQPSSNLSAEEAYKILGLKKGCSKEDVIKATNGLQKKIHPDVNPNSNTERLSQIVNEAKETILKFDFS